MRAHLILPPALLALLACSGLLPPVQVPPEELRVDVLPAGPCGQYHAVVTSDVEAPSLELWANDELVSQGSGRLMEVEGELGPGEVLDAWAQADRRRSQHTRYQGPQWEASLQRTPLGTLPSNDLVPLELQVQSPCLATHRLRLRGTLDGQEALDTELLGDGAASLPLPSLAQGRHPLALELVTETDRQVSSWESFVDVGLPCADVDGDGAPCLSDCDDTDPSVRPGATDVRGDGVDSDCDGVNGQDADADGFEDQAVGGDDCDDHDDAVHPGMAEGVDADGDGWVTGDGIDNDCDGRVDEGISAPDCDDSLASVHPDREEEPLPNQLDDNCDGRVDEGTVVFDDDGDGQAEVEGDCDDDDPQVYAGARERPNCRDDDCDSEVDEGLTRPARDDGFEANDTQDEAAWLGHSGERRWSQTLNLVTRDESDGEWFGFSSHDGFWDDWGLDTWIESPPEGTSYRVGFYDESGQPVVVEVLGPEGGHVVFEGISNHDDSDRYLLGVEPITAPREWCPVSVFVKSR